MKKILCIAAVLSLAAPSAFGQARGMSEIVFAGTSGDAPEIAAVASAARKEFERSRQLEPVYVADDSKAQIIVPTALEKDATGEKMTVTFQMRTAKRYIEDVQVTCVTAKMANCGRDIVISAEKFIRDNKDR